MVAAIQWFCRWDASQQPNSFLGLNRESELHFSFCLSNTKEWVRSLTSVMV
jgi:hypothetical protein